MAVNNTLVKAKANNKAVTFTAGDEQINLTPEMVKKYLVSGDASAVTDQEVVMFMMMCKANHLNPWNKEAYCIKYGTQPATMVVGKEAYMKRANAHPQYDGMDDGIVVLVTETGEMVYRKGAITVEGEQLIGGWAEVYRKDRSRSTRVEVPFSEYAGRKKDGSLNGQWSSKPATMIRKVAQVQALREAFPDTLGGLYTADEQGVDEPTDMIFEQPTETTEVKPKSISLPVEDSESLF